MGLTQVNTDGVKDDAVTAGKIPANAVGSSEIADDAVGLAQMAAGTDGQIITYDASGNPVAVGPGTDGQVLTSTGAGSPPAFETLPASGPSLTGSTNNTVVTVTGANALNGEANFHFDGTRAIVGATSHRPIPNQNFNNTGDGSTPLVYVEGTGDSKAISIVSNNTNAWRGSCLHLARSRGANVGDNTIVQNGDSIGMITFNANDGVDFYTTAAQIRVEVDGAPGENDTPGRIIFATTPDGSGNADERMRIDSDGYVTQPSKRGAAFSARHTNNTSYSSNDIIKYNSDGDSWNTFDVGGNYDTSTGKYTTPVAGVYYFEAQAMTTGWSNGNTTQDGLQLKCNHGTLSFPRQRRSTFRTHAENNGYFTNSISGTAKLGAGDTVWVVTSHSCGVSNTQYSYFTGWLIG